MGWLRFCCFLVISACWSHILSISHGFVWCQVVIILRCSVGGGPCPCYSCWRWPIWLPGIRVETWEGFNHVACIIIASAMAGIGLITDSLSGGRRGCNDVGCWRSSQDVFVFGGEFGKIIPNNRTRINKILRKQCQMIACWIPSVWLNCKSISWCLWWRVSSRERVDLLLAVCGFWEKQDLPRKSNIRLVHD